MMSTANAFASCGGEDEDGDQAAGGPETSTSAPPPSPSTASGDQDASARNGTPIRITVGGTELTYWAPGGDLVFYYDSDAPFFNGIVRIGEFAGEMDAIERQSQDFTVTIERG
jgi:hypothetical protein